LCLGTDDCFKRVRARTGYWSGFQARFRALLWTSKPVCGGSENYWILEVDVVSIGCGANPCDSHAFTLLLPKLDRRLRESNVLVVRVTPRPRVIEIGSRCQFLMAAIRVDSHLSADVVFAFHRVARRVVFELRLVGSRAWPVWPFEHGRAFNSYVVLGTFTDGALSFVLTRTRNKFQLRVCHVRASRLPEREGWRAGVNHAVSHPLLVLAGPWVAQSGLVYWLVA
jgi:hypothetical protein